RTSSASAQTKPRTGCSEGLVPHGAQRAPQERTSGQYGNLGLIEAAARLGASPCALRRWAVYERRIPFVRLGRRIVFPVESLDAYVKANHRVSSQTGAGSPDPVRHVTPLDVSARNGDARAGAPSISEGAPAGAAEARGARWGTVHRPMLIKQGPRESP